jgi:hypothetical protein
MPAVDVRPPAVTPHAYVGRPVTVGRAVASYGVSDRHLGGLAALLGHRDNAIRHLRSAIDRDAELGCAVWRLRGQRQLYLACVPVRVP